MSFKSSLALLTLLIAATSLHATSILNLLKDASVVVIGTESGEVQTGKVIYFNLAMERSLVGSLVAGNVVSVRSDSQEPRPVRLADSTGYRGIWFLKQGDGGGWECIPASHSGNGFIAFREFPYPVGSGPLPPALAYDVGSTALPDQVLLEMAAGQHSSTNSGLIINAASGMTSPAVRTAFQYYAASTSSADEFMGLAGLIEMGDVAAVQKVEGIASSVKTGTGDSGRLISAVSLFRVPDPSAAASLGRMALATSNSPQLRLAAAQSLSAIHTADAVPFLGTLLRDPSVGLQLIAAHGISAFVNGVGIPTPQSMPTLSYLNQRQNSTYRTTETEQNLGYAAGQESAFIGYWTSWWGQHAELHSQN